MLFPPPDDHLQKECLSFVIGAMQSLETKKNAPGIFRSNFNEGGCQRFRILAFKRAPKQEPTAIPPSWGFQDLHSRLCLAEFADLFRVVMDHGGRNADNRATISSVQPTSEQGVHGVLAQVVEHESTMSLSSAKNYALRAERSRDPKKQPTF
jgi:hypothetical protein